jgi:hypothetical protein
LNTDLHPGYNNTVRGGEFMNNFARWKRLCVCGAIFLFSSALWAGGGEKQGKLVHVADTRALDGMNLYFANLYNTNRLLFTLEAMLLTAAMGIFLGWLLDILVGLIGLDLNKRSSRE